MAPSYRRRSHFFHTPSWQSSLRKRRHILRPSAVRSHWPWRLALRGIRVLRGEACRMSFRFRQVLQWRPTRCRNLSGRRRVHARPRGRHAQARLCGPWECVDDADEIDNRVPMCIQRAPLTRSAARGVVCHDKVIPIPRGPRYRHSFPCVRERAARALLGGRGRSAGSPPS